MDLDEQYSIVLADDTWHPGVVGIVASRLVEEFGRPTVLIALSGEQGKGSGRSIPKFDLHGALGQSREHLLRYGGHRAAAGITIARDKIPDFAARFNEVARSVLTPADLIPEIRVDLEVGIEGLDGRIESLFRHFEPFGMGNPTPVLMARNVTIARPPRPVGQDGLRLVLDTGTGISQEEQESIFQPFERGRAGKEDDSGGSGLGLAVVDRLVEELGLALEV